MKCFLCDELLLSDELLPQQMRCFISDELPPSLDGGPDAKKEALAQQRFAAFWLKPMNRGFQPPSKDGGNS